MSTCKAKRLSEQSGSLKGSIIAAKNKQLKRAQQVDSLRKEGIKQVGQVKDRDLFIAEISLYAAEGEKTDGTVGLSNSDPKIIKLFLKWLRQFCDVFEQKLRASIYLHDNLDELAAKKHWSKLTKIPISQFRKTYFVKNNPSSFRKTKRNYGIFRIRVSDATLHRRIMGMIDGLLIEN